MQVRRTLQHAGVVCVTGLLLVCAKAAASFVSGAGLLRRCCMQVHWTLQHVDVQCLTGLLPDTVSEQQQQPVDPSAVLLCVCCMQVRWTMQRAAVGCDWCAAG